MAMFLKMIGGKAQHVPYRGELLRPSFGNNG
jgi:hypothetical protein